MALLTSGMRKVVGASSATGAKSHGVTFVSVTQSLNTTTSMGRLTLNILLSFASSSGR
jgi:hypothetical protein